MTFVELLTFRGIRWRRNVVKPAELKLCCPFCGDQRFRLGINPSRGFGHCFNCNWRAKTRAAQRFLRQLDITGVTISDAPEEYGEQLETGVELPKDFTPLGPECIRDDFMWRPLRYLLDRGIPLQQVQKHYVGLTLTGRFAYRIIFPVVYKDELRMVIGRDYTGCKEPKYLNSRGRRVLYNCVPSTSSSRVIHLAEGIIKAFALERVLGVQAGALLGHSVTPDQIEQLHECRYKRVVLWSDPDAAGIQGTRTVAEELTKQGLRVDLVYPVPALQVDELTDEQIVAHAAQLQPFGRALDWRMQLEGAAR